jgi:hypothetical protein
MSPSEFAQDLRQPALHKILWGAEATTPAQFRAAEITPSSFVRVEDALGEPQHRLAIRRQRKTLGWVDRGSVLLVVYTVLSGVTLSGIWHQLALRPLAILFAV